MTNSRANAAKENTDNIIYCESVTFCRCFLETLPYISRSL
jgi:hypothetical protein